ncbi:hypothetical protein Q5P01_026208 [Channa striata]|uniref:Uncharacterized protein n=1 Tax=Channa striata TaxID=64152 RepID=A0AA88IJI5_CHASR|nr:hypothetical protein Q5P01_026208 [Channa striata]
MEDEERQGRSRGGEKGGEANRFFTQPIPPSLFYHLSPEAPVPAPSAWVNAKEDTWQRTDRPKAAWTQSNLARDREKEERERQEDKTAVC